MFIFKAIWKTKNSKQVSTLPIIRIFVSLTLQLPLRTAVVLEDLHKEKESEPVDTYQPSWEWVELWGASLTAGSIGYWNLVCLWTSRKERSLWRLKLHMSSWVAMENRGKNWTYIVLLQTAVRYFLRICLPALCGSCIPGFHRMRILQPLSDHPQYTRMQNHNLDAQLCHATFIRKTWHDWHFFWPSQTR